MPSNKFNLNPVRVINFWAYPKNHKLYGKIKLRLNYCPFKEGEELDIDTDKVRITGVLESKYPENIIILKMAKLLHKDVI